jgi:pyruvate,water dikinase
VKQGLRIIAWFNEISRKDLGMVGGKGGNLGELTRANIPVPPGFVVTADTYFYFVRETGLENLIREKLSGLDVNDSKRLLEVANELKAKISSTPVPQFINDAIKAAYRKMGGGLVAVRSSATAEDLPEASFAGQQRTFLNIQGEEAVVQAVRDCWASLFEPRAIFYRQTNNFDHMKVGLAAPVQRMVQSESSGVMFTIDPLTGDRTHITIEAVFGLGEAIVGGEVTPDRYVVSKEKLEILEKHLNHQDWMLVRNTRGGELNIKVPLQDGKQAAQKLDDDLIKRVAYFGKLIEDHYNFPQDIEWAKEKGDIFIVQSRPVTTIETVRKVVVQPEVKSPVILSGSAASPGIGAGNVRIIPSPDLCDRVLEGDILVAEMTTPDYVPAMKRATAIVTDRGGRTCHAAIVSRELGIPCVVGTDKATDVLKEGQGVTVDGFRGRVHEGIHKVQVIKAAARKRGEVKTKTRIYVNLAEPELAKHVSERDVDGVGLLRAEFIINRIGIHPRHLLAQKRGHEFTDLLFKGLETFAESFTPRPVVYRTTDFKTNEYRGLVGGKDYEGEEENPMLGYRGCSRYISEEDVLHLEVDAIKRVREKHDNLWVMIPFVRTVRQMADVRALLEKMGLMQGPTFKLWMMCEVPSNVFLIEQFLDTGIDGISIGSNDLTQLILGIDRDNEKIAADFDERNPAVMMALEKVIKACVQRGKTASICGQAPSVYPELTEKLVQWGITSVSVSPDMIDQTRDLVAGLEARWHNNSRKAVG